MKKFLIYLSIITVLIIPFITNTSYAQSGGTGQGTGGGSSSGSNYTGIIPKCEGNECGFNDIIITIKSLVDFATGMALMFSVVVIAFVGYNYMTSGDNPGKRADANKMLQKVVIGIVLIMSAWLIVHLIVSVLVNDGLSKSGSFPI